MPTPLKLTSIYWTVKTTPTSVALSIVRSKSCLGCSSPMGLSRVGMGAGILPVRGRWTLCGKPRGLRLSPWNPSQRLGATSTEKGNYFVIRASSHRSGKIIFDLIRHQTTLYLPVDDPRINQFPEWFTVDPNLEYKITASDPKLSNTFSGGKLLEGLPVKLTPRQRLIIAIE